MSDEMIPVGPDDPMGFQCGPDVPCFNDCCRDLNQALTPYDILRMKNALHMDSASFLKAYTTMHSGPESGLPVVGFKPNPATGHACPFVTPEGCAVYEDRPGSCRMYPLARAVARNRHTGQLQEFYARIEEDHCKGGGRGSGRTVAQWLRGQDVLNHNLENDKILELLSLKNQIMPGKLEGRLSDSFYTSLYDLDTFKEQIRAQDLLKDLSMPENLMEKIFEDDLFLLNFSLFWVKYDLFGRDISMDELSWVISSYER